MAEAKKNVWQKLSSIQTQIKAPKNLYNSFGKYNYRNAEGILEALKPYLATEKAMLIMNDDIEHIEGKFFIKTTATFIDTETGESIQNHGYAEMDANHKGMSADQITGCCSSYCRKYTLNAMFLLDDTKDADTDEFKNQSEAQQSEAKQSKAKPTQKKPNIAIIPSCERCGGEIVAMPKPDGSEMPANAVYAFSMKKYNACYCGNCMKELEAK